MHVKKIRKVPQLFEIPVGMKLTAFGKYRPGECELYFAFLVPQNVSLIAGNATNSFCYAEGPIDGDTIEVVAELNVLTFIKEESLHFMTGKIGIAVWDNFHIIQPTHGKSTYNEKSIKLFYFEK